MQRKAESMDTSNEKTTGTTAERQAVPPLKVYLIALAVVGAGIMIVHEGPMHIAGRVITSLQKLVLGI
ncbi:hypothetical protein BCO37747_08150 [Burkholderia contaminans]|jgi:hypothetical protein|uniref:Uncharacterized protein n=3 Tax=Burkholderia cepacia complex TaxID=87882 RepID=A0A6J5JRC2_9BURK|nr:hypothetical protein WR31_25255 [Burkholderia contaminans LMG 23361]MBA9839148.1 hypothetical protein [Burkholderia contaminans]CAB3973665.1 hypothetical protein BLA3211_07620 [Burkholderia aenigmatica]MBA9864458.1 hypothetical protein [Burkholderia contaminans]MCB4328134.1 hypothetical protein [Burkholderia contaminans]